MIAEKDINAVVDDLVAAAQRDNGPTGGRHHVENVDTEVFIPVEADADGVGRVSGTLPGMPVVEPDEPIVDDIDPVYSAKLADAMRQDEIREAATELDRDGEFDSFPAPSLEEALPEFDVDAMLAVLDEVRPGFVPWLYRRMTFPRVAVLFLSIGVLLGTGLGWWLL